MIHCRDECSFPHFIFFLVVVRMGVQLAIRLQPPSHLCGNRIWRVAVDRGDQISSTSGIIHKPILQISSEIIFHSDSRCDINFPPKLVGWTKRTLGPSGERNAPQPVCGHIVLRPRCHPRSVNQVLPTAATPEAPCGLSS